MQREKIFDFVETLRHKFENKSFVEAWWYGKGINEWHVNWPHLVECWQKVLMIISSITICEREISKQITIKSHLWAFLKPYTLNALMWVSLCMIKWKNMEWNVIFGMWCNMRNQIIWFFWGQKSYFSLHIIWKTLNFFLGQIERQKNSYLIIRKITWHVKMPSLIRIPYEVYSQCQPLTPLTKGETKIPRVYMKGFHVNFSGH